MADKERRKDTDDPLAGAQYGPKEPPSKMQRIMDTIADADYYGTMQALGPTGYGMGGLANAIGKTGKAANAGEKASKFKAGGKVASASKRGDGIAQRGKTRGRIV